MISFRSKVNFWEQIVLEDLGVDTTRDKKDPDSSDPDLNLDSGLGVFYSFFISLLMIIVSEVHSLNSWCYSSYCCFYVVIIVG